MRYKNIIYYLKDKTKDIAHNLSFIPYKKRSKRYRVWNKNKEKKFDNRIKHYYTQTNSFFDNIEISVIMPVYNRAFCIKTAIDSVINQSHVKWNLIIINDGSEDNIGDVIKKYENDKRIIYCTQKHVGVSSARNNGLSKARGKYVFYLDADNQWTKDYLRKMIVFMEVGSLNACFSAIQIIDDESCVMGYYGEEFNWMECLELNYIDINGFGHQLKLLENGYRFDETLKRFVDWDFILAITVENRVAYAPFVGVKYYDGVKGNRITFTVETGDRQTALLNHVRRKHSFNHNKIKINHNDIRPKWNKILK